MLAIVLVASVLLCAPGARAAVDVYATIGGVNYFSLLDTATQSWNDLLSTLLQKDYRLNDETTDSSLSDRWLTITREIMAESTIKYVNTTIAYVIAEMEDTTHATGFGVTDSMKLAEENLIKDVATKTGPTHQACKGIADSKVEGPTVYMYRTYKAFTSSIVTCAVILTNFQVVPVVTAETYRRSMDEDTLDDCWYSDTKQSFGKGFINSSQANVQASQQVTHSVTESLTNTVSETISSSKTESLTIGLEVPITAFLPTGAKFSIESSISLTQAWGKTWTEAKTQTSVYSSSSSTSLQLPPHTQIVMQTEVANRTMNLDYDYPVALSYDAYIVFYGPTVISSGEGGIAELIGTLQAHPDYGSSDAASDLYARATASASVVDPDKFTFNDKWKAMAKQIAKNIPLDTQGATLSYAHSGNTTSVYGIKPLYDLTKVALDGSNKGYQLKVGDQLLLDDIPLKGMNQYGVPYYGFDAEYGSWTLVDGLGKPITSATIATIVENLMTGTSTLKCNGEGTVYLKYQIDKTSYPKVVNPDEDNIDYIEALASTAIIQVDITTGADVGAGPFTLNESTIQLGAGDRFTLVATPVNPGSDTYTFTSSKPSVASVDASGNVSANIQGDATITVRSKGMFEMTCKVTVVAAPSGICFDHDQLLMGLGDKVKLSPSLTLAGSTGCVSYKSSDVSITSIDAEGVVTARAIGDVVVTGTTHNGKRAECFIRVVADPVNLIVPGRNPESVVPEPINSSVKIDVPVNNVVGELGVTLLVRDPQGKEVLGIHGLITSGSAHFEINPGQLPPGEYSLWITSPGNGRNRSLPATQVGKLVIRYRPIASYSGDLSVLTGSLLPIPVPVRLSDSDPGNLTALTLSLGGQMATVSFMGDGVATATMPIPSGAAGQIPLFASAPESITQHAIPETRIGTVTVLDQTAILEGDLQSKLGADWHYGKASLTVPVAIQGEGAALDEASGLFGAWNGEALSVGVNWPRSSGVIGRIERSRVNPFALSKAAQPVPGKLVLSVDGKVDTKKDCATFAFSAQEMARLEPGLYMFSLEAKPSGKYEGFAPLTLLTLEIKAPNPKPTEWTMPASLRVSVGQQYQMVKPIPSSGKLPALTVATSNKKIATINGEDVLTTRQSGTATIKARAADGSVLKCKLTVVPNSYTRAKPLYVAGKAALFSSTKKLYYQKGALHGEIFLYNRTGAKLTGLGAHTLELYEGETLIHRETFQPLPFKTALNHKSYKIYKFTLTDAQLPGVSTKSLDLGSKQFQAVIRGGDTIPLTAGTRGVLQAKSLDALPTAMEDAAQPAQ